MRYIVTLIWAFMLGQVVSYIGGALTHGTYNFVLTTVISLIAGLFVILIGMISQPKKEAVHK
ncbi:DUF2929 domain-containing protein [Enterococcus sp. JM4C]|uniref:YjzD family protein n=1 Tax=Candidatus Enterococcus huntleyi TaxID=1857217 RepID=UPI00137A8ED2|nr:YjzD family protein [Enterococcus sp. JM4C]KAF1297451.1 DUF2929 domain-containing protein [Enterococcus sp. JM4C]